MRILFRHVKCMRILIRHVKCMRILIRHVKCMRLLIRHVKCMRYLILHVKCMGYFNSPCKMSGYFNSACKMCHLILTPKKRHTFTVGRQKKNRVYFCGTHLSIACNGMNKMSAIFTICEHTCILKRGKIYG